eukprot:tig00000852_g5017.t1
MRRLSAISPLSIAIVPGGTDDAAANAESPKTLSGIRSSGAEAAVGAAGPKGTARPPRRVSLGVVAALLIVILLSAVVIVAAVSAAYTSSALERLSEYYYGQSAVLVTEHFRRLQAQAEGLSEQLGIAIVNGPIVEFGEEEAGAAGAKDAGVYLAEPTGALAVNSTSGDFPTLAKLFMQALATRGQEAIAFVGITFPNGETLVVTRETEEFEAGHPGAARPFFSIVENRLNGSVAGQMDRYMSYLTPAGQRVTFDVLHADPTEFRIRVFYKLALSRRRRAWTPVHPFVFGRSGFTCTRPLYAGRAGSCGRCCGLRGAAGDDPTGTPRAAAVRDGTPVTRRGASGAFEYIPAAQLAPEVGELLRALPFPTVRSVPSSSAETKLHALSFGLRGQRYGGRLVKILGRADKPDELQLAVAVIAPEADVLGEVRHLTPIVAAVCAVSCALALLLSLFVLRAFATAMKRVSDELSSLAFLDAASAPGHLRAPREPRCGRLRPWTLRELDQVDVALRSMEEALSVAGSIGDALLIADPAGRLIASNAAVRPAPPRPARSAPRRRAGARGAGAAGAASVRGRGCGAAAAGAGGAAAGARGRPLGEALRAARAAGTALECAALSPDACPPHPVEVTVAPATYCGGAVDVLVVRDVAERKRMEEAVREQEAAARVIAEDLRRLIASADAPIFSLDEELRIVEANGAAEAATLDALRASLAGARVSGRECALAPRPGPAAARRGAPRSPTSAASAASGSTRSHTGSLSELVPIPSAAARPSSAPRLLFSSTARRDAGGRVVGVLVVAQDIAEKRRAIELEVANETKTRFLAYTVHELRTPLSGVLGMYDLLEETELTGEQRELASSIRQCGEQLLALVNDLLDLHKIEAGKVELEAVPFDLRELLEETLEMVAPAALSKGLEVAFRLPPALPTRLRGDPHRLKQVVGNLIANAVKFSGAGSVVAYVSGLALRGPASAPRLAFRVDVQDTGPGMDEEAVRRLFADYSQADASITRLFGGTGMGLVISKRLVELMEGTIRVASRPGPAPASPSSWPCRWSPGDGPRPPPELDDSVRPALPAPLRAPGPDAGRAGGGRRWPSGGGGAGHRGGVRAPGGLSAAAAKGLAGEGPDDEGPAVIVGHADPPSPTSSPSAPPAPPRPAAGPHAPQEAVLGLGAAGAASSPPSPPRRPPPPSAPRRGGAGALVLLDEPLAGALERALTDPAPPRHAPRRDGPHVQPPAPPRLLQHRGGGVGGPAGVLHKPLRLNRLAACLKEGAARAGGRRRSADGPSAPTSPALAAELPPPGAPRPAWRRRWGARPSCSSSVRRAGRRRAPAVAPGGCGALSGAGGGRRRGDEPEGCERAGGGGAVPAAAVDLVLMDVEMPVLDGRAATRELRALDAAGQLPPRVPLPGMPERLPIVALTANSLDGISESCAGAGMDETLVKPVRREQLRAALLRFTGWGP